jgi:hypothetical protein
LIPSPWLRNPRIYSSTCCSRHLISFFCSSISVLFDSLSPRVWRTCHPPCICGFIQTPHHARIGRLASFAPINPAPNPLAYYFPQIPRQTIREKQDRKKDTC